MMIVTIEVPDNIGSLSSVAQLDTMLHASVVALLKIASDGTPAARASARIAAGILAPFGVDNYGRPFGTQEEADQWHHAVAQRDANQAAAGWGGTTPIERGKAGQIVPQEVSKRHAYELAEGQSIALQIDIPYGQFADQTFRTAVAEYQASPSQWEIGFSRTPFSFETAELRGGGVEAEVHCEIFPAKDATEAATQVFSPGRWYINVKLVKNGKEGAPTQNFCVEWFGPHDHVMA